MPHTPQHNNFFNLFDTEFDNDFGIKDPSAVPNGNVTELDPRFSVFNENSFPNGSPLDINTGSGLAPRQPKFNINSTLPSSFSGVDFPDLAEIDDDEDFEDTGEDFFVDPQFKLSKRQLRKNSTAKNENILKNRPANEQRLFDIARRASTFGAGVSLPSAAHQLGKSLAFTGEDKTANNLRKFGSIGKLVTGIGRGVLSGFAGQSRNQDVIADYYKRLAESQRGEFEASNIEGAPSQNNFIFRDGGQKRVSGMEQTGDFLFEIPLKEPNAELEDGEYLKNPDGSIQKAKGERHENGGVKVILEDGTKVISDNLKIDKAAKEFKEIFKVKVTSKDTYAQVMNKVSDRIGMTEVIEEQAHTLDQLEDQKETKHDQTAEINKSFLRTKSNQLELVKRALSKKMKPAFEKVYSEQEISKGNDVAPVDVLPQYRKGGMTSNPQFKALCDKHGLSVEQGLELMKKGGKKQYTGGGNFGGDDTAFTIVGAMLDNKDVTSARIIEMLDKDLGGLDMDSYQAFLTFIDENDLGSRSDLESAFDKFRFQKQISNLPEGLTESKLRELMTPVNGKTPLLELLDQATGSSASNIQVLSDFDLVLGDGSPEAVLDFLTEFGFELGDDKAVKKFAKNLGAKSASSESTPDSTQTTPKGTPKATPSPSNSSFKNALTNPNRPDINGVQHEDEEGVFGGVNKSSAIGWYVANMPELANKFFEKKNGTFDFKEGISANEFQEAYNTYLGDTENFFREYAENNISDETEREEYLASLGNFVGNQKFIAGDTARALDDQFGQFTSTRGSFQQQVVTPSELKLLQQSGINTFSQLTNPKNQKLASEIIGKEKLGSFTTQKEKFGSVDFKLDDIEKAGAATISTEDGADNGFNKLDIQRRVKELGFPILPDQSVLPPSALQPHLLGRVDLDTIDPVRIAHEPFVRASVENLEVVEDQIAGLPASQRMSVLANAQATNTKAINDQLGKIEIANAENFQQTEKFNAGQRTREEITNLEQELGFEERQLRAVGLTDADINNYFEANKKIAVGEFNTRQRLNIINSLFDNYKLNEIGELELFNDGAPFLQFPNSTASPALNPDSSITEGERTESFNNR